MDEKQIQQLIENQSYNMGKALEILLDEDATALDLLEASELIAHEAARLDEGAVMEKVTSRMDEVFDDMFKEIVGELEDLVEGDPYTETIPF